MKVAVKKDRYGELLVFFYGMTRNMKFDAYCVDDDTHFDADADFIKSCRNASEEEVEEALEALERRGYEDIKIMQNMYYK